ncbi:MAG: integrase core domain-containing protein [Candidatus Nanopelagicales bacterium]
MISFAERWVQLPKRECLSRMIVFGERNLQRVLGDYVAPYNRDRPHQGVGNHLVTPPACDPPTDGEVVAEERLGGMLRSYRYSA